MGELMSYLAFVIGSRPDDPYFLWSMNLIGEFEAILHDYEDSETIPGVVSEEVQTWCRYVDQHAHREFLNLVQPHLQAELDYLARFRDEDEIDVRENTGHGEEDRRERQTFNQRRKMPMLVAQMHGLGEQASSSRTRPTWVLPAPPSVEVSDVATSWEVWCAEALHDIRGWATAGCRTSYVLPALLGEYGLGGLRPTREMDGPAWKTFG